MHIFDDELKKYLYSSIVKTALHSDKISEMQYKFAFPKKTRTSVIAFKKVTNGEESLWNIMEADFDDMLKPHMKLVSKCDDEELNYILKEMYL